MMVEISSGFRQFMQILLHGILREAVANGKYPDRFLLRIRSSGKKDQYEHTNHYISILLHYNQYDKNQTLFHRTNA